MCLKAAWAGSGWIFQLLELFAVLDTEGSVGDERGVVTAGPLGGAAKVPHSCGLRQCGVYLLRADPQRQIQIFEKGRR